MYTQISGIEEFARKYGHINQKFSKKYACGCGDETEEDSRGYLMSAICFSYWLCPRIGEVLPNFMGIMINHEILG